MITFGIAISAMLVLQLLLPQWWWVMVVPFVAALLRPFTGGKAFLMGSASAGVVWFCASAVLLLTHSSLIATRMARMLDLGSPWVLVLLTTLVAVIAGGVAAAAGQALRPRLRPFIP